MSRHPANLVLRLVLEIISLVVVGQWVWQLFTGPLQYVLAFGFPVLLAILWGVFRCADDPIQVKQPPINVSGRVRLALELIFFALALYAAFASRASIFGWIFLLLLLLHHFWSFDRLVSMLRHP